MHGLGVILYLVLVYFLVCWPFGRIFSRAGHSQWLSLLMLVPLVNLIMIWWFAFAEWKTAPS
jgi:hypothetical protein